ncbi:MAG TPA: TolC family protein [Acidobacteriaceae bacterium]|nr:TolC family protein [Acidobacteriaceae bacterium]
MLALVALLCAAPALGQNVPAPSTAQDHNLPSAPSAVLLSQKDEALGRPAGSGFTFKAPGTLAGPNGVAIEQPSDTPLRISLDDAISLGLERNVRLIYDRARQKSVRGEQLGVINALLPSLRASASTGRDEINLAALGFKPQSLGGLLSQFGLTPAGFSTIVKVNTTQAMISANQDLFDIPAYELYRGAKRETEVVDLDALTSRGDLVLAVGSAYLQVLADQTNLTNAQAQARAAYTLFDQARQRRKAGVGTSLDELRGQVEYQQRQQATIAADNQLAKDKIQLNRIMGLPAGQKLELTDTAPFTELADMDLDRAKATAYRHRKDLLSLEAQIQVADRELRAVRYQRLPTLAFNGFYGVLGETTGLYHGVFTAEGSLKFPIFREAGQRGQADQVNAQLTALHQRESDLRVTIDAQIRASMLDVQSADQLVKVAQSNIGLAQQELADERDRFTAGVEDNLAVVDAQASVTAAQFQLVKALYQDNVAKLNLARSTGVIETRYRMYLGK